MEYLNNLTKGSGKGKIAAVVNMTARVSFKKQSIGGTVVKNYKEFLEQYVGYDKVYIISTSIKEQKLNDYCERDSVIFGINRKNLFNDLHIDDIFCGQNNLNFFGGVLNDYVFCISNRIVEWYKEHGDGHCYTIQDDPEWITINPLPKIELRLKNQSNSTRKPYIYDENTEDAKLFIEYQKTGLLHQCLNNTIVAHCGINYPQFFNKRIKDKIGQANVVTEPKYWCKFNCYIWQGVNSNLTEKFKDYSVVDRKYQSEYHGYVKHDKERINTTLSFYNELNGPIKIIESKGHFSDDFKNCKKFDAVPYSELFNEICKDSYTTFITANASTFDDFISPRYFDCMMSDIIPFVYHKYDSEKVYTDNQELKDFMYVSTPEDFKQKVEKLIGNENYFRHIKYIQRKSIYDNFNDFMTDESKKIFEEYLENNKH